MYLTPRQLKKMPAWTIWRGVLFTRRLGAFLQETHVLAQAVAKRLGGDDGGNRGRWSGAIGGRERFGGRGSWDVDVDLCENGSLRLLLGA